MKKIAHNVMVLMAIASISGFFAACNKTESPTPTANSHWVKVYKDVILGDQDNYNVGQFFKSENGEVVALEQGKSQAKFLTMMYFTGYGNAPYLTFPGNGLSTGDLLIDENRLFYEPNFGIISWPQADVNTGEITRAAKGFIDGTSQVNFMKPEEFNTLIATLTWEAFIAKYKAYNSGVEDLSFESNYVLVENGAIYLIQLNDYVRGIVYVKNVISDGGSAGGSLKFDIILEGREAYEKNKSSEYIQPSKD